jgi:hypothetical protein
MTDFVRPDTIHQVPIQGGVLSISPSIDFLHHFPNDAWVLKYWNSEGGNMCNVFMTGESAHFLNRVCGVEIMERQYMGTQEHEQYLGWASMTLLTELDFEAEDGQGTDIPTTE